MAGTERAEGLADRVEDVKQRVPGRWRAMAEGATRHQTLVLAAGLAFFGLLSLAPAVGVSLGALRLLASEQAVSALVDALQGRFTETLGLADLLEQMEDQAGRYAGLGLLILLWPATTLASGWKRALDAVYEQESPPALRGLLGRAKGLAVGLVLLVVILALLAAIVAGAAAAEYVVLAGVAVGAVGLQFAFSMLVYRFLPAVSPPWSALWRGAAVSTVGVCLVTVAFGVALTVAEGLAEQYPPALSTAVVLGLWLYGANLSLLLGAELNAAEGAAG